MNYEVVIGVYFIAYRFGSAGSPGVPSAFKHCMSGPRYKRRGKTVNLKTVFRELNDNTQTGGVR